MKTLGLQTIYYFIIGTEIKEGVILSAPTWVNTQILKGKDYLPTTVPKKYTLLELTFRSKPWQYDTKRPGNIKVTE